jgi:hypothetical protein
LLLCGAVVESLPQACATAKAATAQSVVPRLSAAVENIENIVLISLE